MVAPWTFFVDRSCGAQLVPEALRNAGEIVEVHDDLFPQDAADEDWVPVVSDNDRLVITKDSAIARNRLQRLMVAANRTRLFVLTFAGIPGPEMAEVTACAAAKMRRLAARAEPPFIAKVHRDGRVQLWKDGGALLEELKAFVPRARPR
jgi:hypothetical protein